MKLCSGFLVVCVLMCAGVWAQDDCECTVYYLCDAANTVPTSSKCSGPEVCCRANGPTNSPIVTAPTPATRPTTSRPTSPRSNLPNVNNDEDNCECVPAVQCPEVSGANQLDIRLKSCPPDQVCCPRGSSGNNGGGGSNNNGGGSNNNGGGSNNNGGGNNNNGGDDMDQFQECGIRTASDKQFTSFRISGSNSEKADTFFGEYPWMMAVLTTRTNKDGSITENVFQCGATLILPTVVMTAAHCVNNVPVGDIKVRGGEWDTVSNNKTDREPFPYQERTVSQIYIHEKFEAATVYNDIALLILDFPFPVKDHIGLICTPNSAEEYDDQKCLVTGWGRDKFGQEGRYQSVLKKVDLKLVSRNQCQDKLRKTRLGQAFKLHESFICAIGGPNQDACKGDGGGPLVCQVKGQPNHYTQVGIVAWGIGCGSDTPGVYVDVRKYKKWILDNSHGQTIDVRIRNKN